MEFQPKSAARSSRVSAKSPTVEHSLDSIHVQGCFQKVSVVHGVHTSHSGSDLYGSDQKISEKYFTLEVQLFMQEENPWNGFSLVS